MLVDIAGAVYHGPVHLARVLNLHALLDDCDEGNRQTCFRVRYGDCARKGSYHRRGS